MKSFFLLTLLITVLLFPLHIFASGTHGGDHSPDTSQHWKAPANMAKRTNPVPKTPETIQLGKDLYMNSCASCHGDEARGDGPMAKVLKKKPSDLTAMAGNHLDGDFAWKIARGRGSMPGWEKTLTEEQIWKLVNFIQNLTNTADTKRANSKKH